MITASKRISRSAHDKASDHGKLPPSNGSAVTDLTNFTGNLLHTGCWLAAARSTGNPERVILYASRSDYVGNSGPKLDQTAHRHTGSSRHRRNEGL